MTTDEFSSVFNSDTLGKLIPDDLSNQFFEALYGDAKEGAYDISFRYAGNSNNELTFEFHLNERPGKCLACNLTYGLPEVFKRHPLINVKGLVEEIGKKLDGKYTVTDWRMGRTREISRHLHIIPLTVLLAG